MSSLSPPPLRPTPRLSRFQYFGVFCISIGWMGMGLFAVIASIFFYHSIYSYSQGHCTILSKHLVTVQSGDAPVYRPNFTYTVFTADGKTYQASGYDGSSEATGDYRGEQALVDHYQIGGTYPCWYSPNNPTTAILARNISMLPLVFGAFGFAGLILFLIVRRGYRLRDWRSERLASDIHDSQREGSGHRFSEKFSTH